MKMPKNCTNILIVGLDKSFCYCVAETIGERLQMHFSSCESIVSYYIQERDLILEKVGLDYLKKREKNALEECSNYCNCVLSINYDLFKHNYSLFNKSVICYLRLNEDQLLGIQDKIMFKQRDDFLMKHSHLQFDIPRKDKRSVSKNIIYKLGEIL